MNKNLLKSLLVAVVAMMGLSASAQDTQTASATVKMTYIDNDQADVAMGEIAAGSAARAGYNKISGETVGWGNAAWGENKVTYIQVDASAVSGTIISATLNAEVSGSSDSKRNTTWGVGYNSSVWSAEMTASTADLSITTCGATYTTTTKSATTFEAASFDITNAFVNDADGDKIVTILVYETAAAGGYIQNPTVEVTYSTAATANYTIKYVDGEGNTVRESASRVGFVGQAGEVTDDDKASIVTDSVKYVYASDDVASQTVAEDGSTVITVVFREAETWSYTINAVIGDNTYPVATGTDYEGETITFNYPKYYNVDGTLYEINRQILGSGYFQGSFELTADSMVYNVSGYNATSTTNVVYYSEAEDIESLTTSTAANMNIRCSNGLGAYNADSVAAEIVTLNPGTYTLTTSVWGGEGVNFVFKAGEQTIGDFACLGYIYDYTTAEFTLTERTTITLDPTTNAARCIDLVYITGTGSVFDINTIPTIESIAALDTLASGTEVTLSLQAVVTFANDSVAYVQDEYTNDAIKTKGFGFVAGNIVSGTVSGTYVANEGEQPMLVASDLTSTETYDTWESYYIFTPAVVKIDEIADHQSQLVTIVPDAPTAMGFIINTGTEINTGFGSAVWSDEYSVLPEGYTWPSEIAAINVIVEGQTLILVDTTSIVEPVNNIAELKQMANGSTVALKLDGAQVSLLNEGFFGKTVFVEDATGAMSIIGSGFSWTGEADIFSALPEAFSAEGNKLSGVLYGQFVNEYGQIGMQYNASTAISDVTVTAGVPTPTVMSLSDAMDKSKAVDNFFRLIQIKDAKIETVYEEWDGELYPMGSKLISGKDTIDYMDTYGRMQEVTETEFLSIDGLLFVDLADTIFAFYPNGNYSVPVYKAFEADQVLAGDQTTIEAAAAEGWVVTGGTYVTNKKGNIDINTGEAVDAANMPGVGVKKGNSAKSLQTYITNVTELTAYGSSTSSSATRTLVVTATPSDGSDAVTGQADAAPNETGVVTIALDPTKQYIVDYTGVEGESGGDVVVFGIKFVAGDALPEPEPAGRKWDFTVWSEATIANLTADAADVAIVGEDGTLTYPEAGTETGWRTYEKDGGPTEADPDKGGACFWLGSMMSEPAELTANGVTIAETAGLLFNNVSNLNNTFAIAINYPETSIGTYHGGAYLWLNGAGRQITIPAVAPGDTIKMGVESHRNGSGRGVNVSVAGEQIGTCTPEAYEDFAWVVPASEADSVDVLVEANNGCHIYYIEIVAGEAGGETDGISSLPVVNMQNANVYTLGGVMVRKAGESLEGLAKGLYIMGGKKIVIK